MDIRQLGSILLKSRWRRLAHVVIIVFALVLGYWLLTSLWTYTSDAYVYADFTRINARIPGYVDHIAVNDYQQVKKGQPLLSIDPQPYKLKLAKAKGQLAVAHHQFKQAQTQLKMDKAKRQLAENRLKLALKKLKRYRRLNQKGRIAQQTVDDQKSQYDLAQKAFDVAKQQVKSQRLKIKSKQQDTQTLQASLALARYHLNLTDIKAPYAGYITKIRVGEGTYLKAGEPAFALVKKDSLYVLANFKSSSLRSVHVGDTTYIQTDIHGWFHWLKGHVVDISPAISRRSQKKRPVIPYVKPRLNWIRLQRRFPVKIKIDHPPDKPPLRMGANARVIINQY